jgi:predicted phosphodiesterase
MRLAVLSDIHGNLTALQAVLADLQSQGSMDHTWVLGDLAAFGPDPAGCIQAVQEIPNVKAIQGNTERYLVTGARPTHRVPDEAAWSDLKNGILPRDLSYAWTTSQLDWSQAEYLLKLRHHLSLEAPGYGWVVAFHAIPGNDEVGISPDTPDYQVRDALLDVEGSLALGGHTHLPLDRDLGDWRVVNPGSVGFPADGDTRAAYAILTFENGAVSVDQRRVPYDIEAVVARYAEVGHPAPDQYIRRLRTAKS